MNETSCTNIPRIPTGVSTEGVECANSVLQFCQATLGGSDLASSAEQSHERCEDVGGFVAMNFIFPILIGNVNHPNWRTHIFQRGGPGPPTSEDVLRSSQIHVDLAPSSGSYELFLVCWACLLKKHSKNSISLSNGFNHFKYQMNVNDCKWM